ncbi:MAG: hypothetical protein HYZ12_02835 [Thaumarchaeota archaeon]|nr:hypothetical protein [Nitrososphaerota archaeon]
MGQITVEKTYSARIVRIQDETHDTKTYDLVFRSDQFHFTPGQEVKLYADTPLRKNDWRFYSLTSSPTMKERIQLTMKHEAGTFTPYFLNHARVGDTYAISEPRGKFLSKAIELASEGKIKTIALLGASSGVAPFKSFIEYSIEKGWDLDIVLFHSVKTMNDWIYRSVLLDLLKKFEGLKTVLAFTREKEESTRDHDPSEYTVDRFYFLTERRFQLEDVARHVPEYTGAYYAICGGITFIGGVKTNGELGMMQKLIRGGVPRENIDIASFGAK